MRPASEKLLGVVQSSHTARSRITVVTGFPQSTTPTGTRLTVLGGDVRMDSSAVVRATLDCTVLAPWGSIKPNGTELFVEYGVEIEGGRTEWVALGYFGVQKVEQTEVNGPLRISGADRMARVVDTGSVDEKVVPAATTHAAFYSSLLYGQPSPTWFTSGGGVFPAGVTAEDIVSDYTMSGSTVGYDLPLDKQFDEHMRKVASDSRKRLFFDYKGRLNVVDEAVEVDEENSVATISAGAGGQLSGLSRLLTREGIYNQVRVEGEQPVEGAAPWGTAWNNTLYGIGREQAFGNVVYRYSSPVLTTPSACEAAALTWRNKIQGLSYTTSFRMAPNPALEPLDVVTLRFPAGGPTGTIPRPGYATAELEVHAIDTLTFPLAGGDMTVTTREGWVTG